MRLNDGSRAGLLAASFLLALSLLLMSKSADAGGFDCARASLQVDFVICRSEDGRRAIADLTRAWEKLTSIAAADRKAALLDQQRRWIGVYQLICGLRGRGQPATDPTQRTDRCVVDQLRQRKNVLEWIVASIDVRGRDGPYTFLDELYSPYQSGGSTVILDSNADLYFAPILAKTFQADQLESKRTNLPPRFDRDPLAGSHEQVRVSGLQIQVVPLDPTHARGVVSYHLSENAPPTTLTIDLIHTERGWRVADIFYSATAGIPEASLFRILSGVPPTAPTPDCAFQPALSIDTRSAMKAGDWLPINWSRCAPTSRLEEPTFLVIAVPDEVRLRGIGFYALRPHARAPYGFDFEPERARIIIPLHQPLMPQLGTLQVQPALAGQLSINAAVFRRDQDRNVVLWRSNPMTKTVEPGPISVSVWQEVSSEAPREVRQSNDGRWELRIYKDSYEVIDPRTGDLVIRRAGSNPAFSPTQRFLIASTGEGYDEIIDLVARRVIRQHVRNFLIWLYEDSFVLENWGRYCNVIAVDTLVDETDEISDPVVGAGPGACNAWEASQVDLSIDGGYIGNSSAENEPPSGAYGVGSLTRLPVSSEALQSSLSVRIAWMRVNFEKSYAGSPRTWRLHDSMRIVSNDLPPEADQSIRPYMTSASHVVSDAGAFHLAGDPVRREPITRGIRGGGGAQPSSLEMSFRKMLGNLPGPIVVAERGSIESRYFRTNSPDVPAGVAGTNVFGLPALAISTMAGSCDDPKIASGDPSFIKAGDVVFEVPSIGNFISQIGYWPSPSVDLVVLSFVFHGTDEGEEETRILRRRQDGQWLSDCRHAKVAQNHSDGEVGAHAGEIPPELFRFPPGDVALLYVAFHQLLLSPAIQSEPICILSGVREPETLQTLARLGSNLILLLNRTGDLDVFECPSGRHVISGALLDDELLVYTDQGWFDGSDEAASFVQVRLAGVPGRYPLMQFEDALRRPGILKDALEGKSEPPIALSEPPYVRLGPDGKTVLAGDAKALAAVRFYDDGVMVGETAINGHQGSVSVPSDKLSDARQAAVVAVNAAGVQSGPLPLPSANPATSRKGRLIGLTVGIDKYNDWRVPELHFAEHDAIALAGALDRYDQGHVEASVASLTGEEATISAILRAVRTKVAEATRSDTLVFSFAGHGVADRGDLFLLTTETDYGDLKTALSWSDLEAAFAQSAARIVVFLDACQSGTAALGSGDQHEAAIDRLRNWKGPPMLIFAASKGSQSAAESMTAGGGLFTAAMIDALRDRGDTGRSTRLLSLDELYASVKRKVAAENPNQIPWFGRRGLLGNFVLF
jgi:uncharacterized caspase-like protein/uncharacterized protein YecT (DUF1311 family)